MDFVIIPYEGTENIKFGMSVEEVRRTLNSDVNAFLKSSTSEFPTDAFDALGVYISYKKSGVCDAIEFAPPANPIFQAQVLIGRPFDELLKWFQARDNTLSVDDSGLTSLLYGIGLYAPYAVSSPDELVEGVIIFEKGYYDS